MKAFLGFVIGASASGVLFYNATASADTPTDGPICPPLIEQPVADGSYQSTEDALSAMAAARVIAPMIERTKAGEVFGLPEMLEWKSAMEQYTHHNVVGPYRTYGFYDYLSRCETEDKKFCHLAQQSMAWWSLDHIEP